MTCLPDDPKDAERFSDRMQRRVVEKPAGYPHIPDFKLWGSHIHTVHQL